jgi:hypothetical protein
MSSDIIFTEWTNVEGVLHISICHVYDSPVFKIICAKNKRNTYSPLVRTFTKGRLISESKIQFDLEDCKKEAKELCLKIISTIK